ncbi:sigma-70 family RNA polymerase sigma factor [Terrimonas sp. NA20]|uniref:Sigma-70 family RNA polymerase sigma factor n=1 Tax=Terrimonas ginsenosidimutans TaxID=2908004 RepID=A0ABS9KSU1_9BACT|nr:sigma-70 family RNA polymerase sigma factor [Terrimonas ginsenosidimutans]MCG2615369.1 sigma-70 family RNA polymerase sigma factor [Terrimonas ginsenosidimutans]
MGQDSVVPHIAAQEQLQALKANDEIVLQQLYHANYYKVENFVVNNSGTPDQAKDVFQEAFIAVWRNIQLGKFQLLGNASLEAYLFQVAKNKWMDQLRSAHHTKVVRIDSTAMPEGRTTDEQDSFLDENIAAVKKYFGKLGENCRKILTLFYYDDASMKDIADQMNWTEATAKNNKYRCIQQLKEMLNKKA